MNARRSNTGLIIGITLAIGAVICGGCIGLVGLLVSNVPAPHSTSRPPASRVEVAMNEPGLDGKFQFTVTSVECGVTQVGSRFLNKTAQGQFCLVRVTVTNIGDESKTFTSSNQYAYNEAGQRYDADTSAGFYIDDSKAFLEDINPGNTVNGTLVFDIPVGQKISKLEFHDSAFSGGVTVAVS